MPLHDLIEALNHDDDIERRVAIADLVEMGSERLGNLKLLGSGIV